MNLEVIAEREEHGVMMCMKGRKNNSELYKDVHLFEFVVSYAMFCF